jgi:hypothetical protein
MYFFIHNSNPDPKLRLKPDPNKKINKKFESTTLEYFWLDEALDPEKIFKSSLNYF